MNPFKRSRKKGRNSVTGFSICIHPAVICAILAKIADSINQEYPITIYQPIVNPDFIFYCIALLKFVTSSQRMVALAGARSTTVTANGASGNLIGGLGGTGAWIRVRVYLRTARAGHKQHANQGNVYYFYGDGFVHYLRYLRR